ncbi:DUF5916 domain-containing protein [Candidatus Eisenbacteria bacterium]|uniref:DUF5916 domain-containing protein n=1 Tax=Eiseniibacteriota bacterium TaxID=2212470 RepID=A0ABV6YIL2_UNCEI
MKSVKVPDYILKGLKQTAVVGAACLAVGGFLFLAANTAGATFAGFHEAEETGEASHEAAPSNAACPSLHALALATGERISVDGRLDDAVWSRAASGCGFRVWDPDRGSPASEQTIFKVAYDEDALYFAVACLENDPSQIAKCLSRRDQFSNSDIVSIYIDPYNDKSTGYNFRVNPLGVQEDSYMFNDGDRDQDWDAVWQAETFEDADGWYAELRIPFSSIRYRADAPSWGLQVYRYMHARGEDTAWVLWDRETAGFVSRFGSLHGIRGIPAPRQLEVMPYMVYRTTDPSVSGPEERDDFQNMGLDLKYGVTADLTLNATLQPDFGQVEADPALLNLSPFETFFQEKRPFFVEGNRFFEHPGFRMFYSRRIGTGDENSRIRYAAKLTGKTEGDVSVAALLASTDVTADGQAHNIFKTGECTSHYAIGRFGKEFNQGNQRINLVQTGVFRKASRDEYGNYDSREAYTSGLDFELLFRDRTWSVSGSAVGSIIDPEALASDPEYVPQKSYGTGGNVQVFKRGGKFRGSAYARWETGGLNLNDMGFLSSPDELSVGTWMQYSYTPDGGSDLLNRGDFNLNLNWDGLYEPRTGFDLHSGDPIWSYRRGHRANANSNINGWMQFRNYMEGWFGLSINPEGSQRWHTGDWAVNEDGDDVEIPGGGPLIDEPWTWGGWLGGHTDSRKNLVMDLELNHYNDAAGNASIRVGSGVRWHQSSAIQHRIGLSFHDRIDDTQHLENYENPGGGIGGVSYVFGDLHQQIFDLTLRTSVLFSRNQSLEIYAQPYITTGDYRRVRELARPDTYDLREYKDNDFNIEDWDFTYSAVNVNAVYRWEYRPGSTLYLVWTHSRSTYDERRDYDTRDGFDLTMSPDALFNNEPENKVLMKFSYWLPI